LLQSFKSYSTSAFFGIKLHTNITNQKLQEL
jgi:hypothetical protein